MATFHDFDPLALWGFLTSGRYVWCPPGRTLLAEGAPSPAYYLTINGAVERVLLRDDWRVRVGLVGPGRAFGYERPHRRPPVARHGDHAERRSSSSCRASCSSSSSNGEDAVSRGFLDVIQNDLMATARETLRPCARLAASA